MANNASGQLIYNGFLARGFTPVQSAVLAGNMQQESSFNPDAYNADEGAYGGFQWRKDRKSGLENYATATGRAANDINAQMDWVVQEMLGPESRNAQSFLTATTPEAANQAIKRYIRWGDNSDGARLQNAMAYMAPAPANNALQAIGEATPANMLTGDANRFVNPAFGNNSEFQMPAAPPAAPQQAPMPAMQPMEPVAAPAAAPMPAQAAAPPALSDDDLLNQFMPAAPSGMPAPPTAAAAPQAVSPTDDDALLSQWANPAPDAVRVPAIAAVPAEAAPEFAPGVVGGDIMAPGTPEPQAQNADYQPSSVPFLDPINAFANSAVNAIPIVGPKLTEMGNSFDAGFNNMLTGQNQTAEDRAAINAAEQAKFPIAAGAGAVAGTVAPFVAAGAVPIGAKMLGMSGPVASRVGMGLVSGGAISGADTLARGGTAEDAGRNALTGAVVGGLLPAAAGAVNKLLAPAVAPRVAALAQMARDRFGITIGPGQISTNPTIRFLDSVVNKIPLSGGTASREAQQTAFNNAVSRTFGENAEAITPDVLESASKRIGDVFDSVAQRTPAIKADPQFDQQMIDAMTTAQQTLTDAEMVPLTRQFDALVGKFQQGGNAIDGETYQAMTRKGTPLDLALNSPNPNIRHVAGDFREALDGALERSAAPEVMDDLLAARAQWKALKTIQRLAEKGPIGDVNPALLQGAVATSYKGMPNSGAGGDLANLARIGQQFLKAPPSSGTAERLAMMNLLTKGGSAAGAVGALALNPGMVIPAALATAGTLGSGRLIGAALRSKTLANMLIGNGLKGTGPARNALMAPAIPTLLGTGQGVAPHQPLRITVTGARAAQ